MNGVMISSINDTEPFAKENVRDHVYSNVHVMQVGSNVNNQQNVRLSIELIARTRFIKKVLKVKLTDDNNPFFIYTLELSDEDYAQLKRMQGLLIDFCHFPNELTSLLKKCKNEQEGNTRFFITFEENSDNHHNKDEAVLKIMETNCLKVLCHLALSLTPASIGDVKKEVLAKIMNLKETIHKYEYNQRESENKIQELVGNSEQKNKECDELRSQWDEQQRIWGLSLSKQINEIREEYSKKHNDAVLEMKQKEEEMKLLHSRVVEQLKENLEVLKIEKTHLTKSNLDLDLNVRNQVCKINSLEAKVDILEEDLQASKYTLHEKTKDLETKETTIKTLKTRLSNTDKLLMESTKKQSALETTSEELRKEKNKILNVLKIKEQTIQNNNDHLKSVCGDLVKANSIIRQIQRDNNIYKMKLDKALQYFQEQTTKLVKCSEQLHAMKEASEAKKKELDYLQKTALSTNDTLKELKKDLLSTKEMTRLHDKEIMDLKQQPASKEYKINDQFRKQCLENVYLSRPPVLTDYETNLPKNSGNPDEYSLDTIRNGDFTSRNSDSARVLKTVRSVRDVNPIADGTRSQNEKQATESKRPNVPIVDIDDETKLPEPARKPQKNTQSAKEKTAPKRIGICRMTGNKPKDYQVASYFQKTELKKP